MLQFQQSLPGLSLDEINLTKEMDRVYGQVLRESGRRWMRTILAHVPVETGMARATMIPIGEYLNNVGGLIFSPVREPYFSKLEGGTQNMDFGIAKTTFDIVDSAHGTWEYTFFWSTDTIHYWVAGFYRGSAVPGPEALEEGERAFFQHFDSTINRRLPNLAPYIT